MGVTRSHWDGTNIGIVSASLTIDSGGIQLGSTTSASPLYAYKFATGFGAALDQVGVYGVEPSSSSRTVSVMNTTTASGKTTTLQLGTSVNSVPATLSLTSNGTTASGYVDAAFSFTSTATFYQQAIVGYATSGDPLLIQVAGVNKVRFDSNGDLRPETDNTQRVGLTTHRLTLIRGVTITSGDYGFENGWAFTESYKVGIAEPGVALVNAAGEVMAFFGESGFHRKPSFDVEDLPHALTTSDERAEMDAHPEQRVKGRSQDGRPIYKTALDVRPFPTSLTTTKQRKGVR